MKLLPELPLAWVEFKVGQMGIFVVERHDLVTHNARIRKLAEARERCAELRREPKTAASGGRVVLRDHRDPLNTFGHLFRVTTFGESPRPGDRLRGRRLSAGHRDRGGGLPRTTSSAAPPARTRHTSQRHEADEVEILSGVYEGRTTGTPIALLIRNTDARSKDYDKIAEQFRPGHADYTYWQKYGIRDPRGGGRSSARETTMRVAAAVIAKKWLADRFGVRVRGYLSQIGDDRAARRSTGPRSKTIRSSGPTPRRWRSWKRTWTRCASPATRSARASTWSPTACRRVGASRSTASSTASWPRR